MAAIISREIAPLRWPCNASYGSVLMRDAGLETAVRLDAAVLFPARPQAPTARSADLRRARSTPLVLQTFCEREALPRSRTALQRRNPEVTISKLCGSAGARHGRDPDEACPQNRSRRKDRYGFIL